MSLTIRSQHPSFGSNGPLRLTGPDFAAVEFVRGPLRLHQASAGGGGAGAMVTLRGQVGAVGGEVEGAPEGGRGVLRCPVLTLVLERL